MKSLITVLTILFVFNGFACLNESGMNLDGEAIEFDFYADELFVQTNRYYTQEKIDEKLTYLNKRLVKAEKSDRDGIYTDISVYMIYNGNYQKAIDYLHLNVIEKDSNYSFCSNIGVAHELVGNLDSALYYTEKALTLNPKSHRASEWIHVKILEAEIAIAKNKDWLKSHTIFGFPLSKDSIPTDFPTDFDTKNFAITSGFQLVERSFFVREENQDPVFSQLILLHADAVAREFDTKKSIPIYQLAADHDTTLKEIVDMRIAYLNALHSNDDLDEDISLNMRHDQREEGQFVDADEDGVADTVEEPKKKRTIIKGLVYYLGGGFVLLVIGMVFFIRKKPKQP